jgi:hypothetical protein
MKQLLAVLSFVFLFSVVFGQDTVNWSSSATAKAAWPKPFSPALPFQFNCWMDIERVHQRDGRTHRVYFVARARWLKSQSFMADSLAHRYQPLAQLYFDCYELESRKLQEAVNLPDNIGWDEVNLAMQQANARISSLRAATDDGKNTGQVAFWRKWMDSSLTATPRLSPPEWIPEKLRLAFDAGTGIAIYNGPLSDYFHPTVGWGYGGGFCYDRFAFEYRMLTAITQAKLGFKVADFEFSDSNRLKINQSTFSLGFQVVNRHRLSVIPYIGASTFRVLNRDVNSGSIYAKGRASLNAEAGFMSEWRFYHLLQNNQTQFFWKLLFKAGYAPVNYLNAIEGGALKFQVGIGFATRSVRNIPFEY